MLVDVEDSEDEVPSLIPGGDEDDTPVLVSSSGMNSTVEDTTPDIPVTIITGQYSYRSFESVIFKSCYIVKLY
jgi:hypothetical protein